MKTNMNTYGITHIPNTNLIIIATNYYAISGLQSTAIFDVVNFMTGETIYRQDGKYY